MKTTNKFLVIALFVSLFAINSTVNAGHTDAQVVGKIQANYNGTTYFRPEGLGVWGGGSWGAGACPNAIFAYIQTGVAGYENIMSVALASKLNGSQVQFFGVCNTEGTYLLITYAHLL